MVEGSTFINISSVGAERGIFLFLVCVVNINWVTYIIGLKDLWGQWVSHWKGACPSDINDFCARVVDRTLYSHPNTPSAWIWSWYWHQKDQLNQTHLLLNHHCSWPNQAFQLVWPRNQFFYPSSIIVPKATNCLHKIRSFLDGTRSDKGMTVHHVPCKLVKLINSCCANAFLC